MFLDWIKIQKSFHNQHASACLLQELFNLYWFLLSCFGFANILACLWSFCHFFKYFVKTTFLFIFLEFLNFILFIFLYSSFLLVIHFMHISVYMSIPISQFITPRFPPLVSICLFSTSVSQFLPCKPVHLYHFSRFHIYAFIYDICFSLSDLLHSARQSLDSSTSLQMTQFRSFLWLSNIPLYICTTSSISIRLLMGI